MPYLNDLISQYECLLAICRFVSSADIAHLAATCKQNRASITASEITHRRLKKNAICDGKGILSQARIFGLHSPGLAHRSGVKVKDWDCQEVKVRPCVDCGANVCNNCRFHCFYFPHACDSEHFEGVPLPEDERLDDFSSQAVWADYERIYLRDYEWDVAQGEEIDNGRYRSYNGPTLLTAWDIFDNKRFLPTCDECELEHLRGNEEPDETSDEESDEESDDEFDGEPNERPDEGTCDCDMFKHFIERWLCIPCLLVEGKRAHDDMQLKKDEDGIMRHLCACGAPAKDGGIPLCKYCGMARPDSPAVAYGY